MKHVLVFLVMITIVTALDKSVQAYKVTHSTAGVVFQDDLEEAVGEPLTAEIGTWGGISNGLPTAIDDAFPGAYSGSTYVQRARPGNHQIEAVLDLSGNGGNAFNSGVLTTEFAIYLNSSDDSHQWNTILVLDDRPGSGENVGEAFAYILEKSACCGNSTNWWDDVSAAPTGVDRVLDEWHTVKLVADLDADTSQLFVNGTAGDLLSARDVAVSRVYSRAEANNKYHYIDAVGETTPLVPPTIFAWNGSTPGNWNSDANWTTDTKSAAPGGTNGTNHLVTFGSSGSQGTVATDQTVTVNSITFDNSSSYNVAGAGQVNLAMATATTTNPGISVVQGSHQFQANVQLENPTTANVATGGSLAFNNLLNLNGNTLTKTGDGTMSINNNLNAGVGDSNVDCQAGTCSGTGTIGGNLLNSASVAAGLSPGILSVDGNYTQSASGTLEIEVMASGGVAGTDYDRLAVALAANLDGTLDIQLDGGYTPTIGDSFAGIVTAVSSSGKFAAVNNVVIDGRRGVAVTYTETTVDAKIGLRGNTDIASGDMDVDTSDLTTSIINFTSAGGTGKTWADGDMDGDSDVDTSDLTTSIINFTSALNRAEAVPEPSTIVSLLLGIGLLAFRPRRA